MDSGLAIALQQEETGPSVDLLPQVGVSTRLMSERCCQHYNALPKRKTIQLDVTLPSSCFPCCVCFYSRPKFGGVALVFKWLTWKLTSTVHIRWIVFHTQPYETPPSTMNVQLLCVNAQPLDLFWTCSKNFVLGNHQHSVDASWKEADACCIQCTPEHVLEVP